jgi:hypothetical protein
MLLFYALEGLSEALSAAAGTTHPAHNNDYYCNLSVTLLSPSGNAQKGGLYPVANPLFRLRSLGCRLEFEPEGKKRRVGARP